MTLPIRLGASDRVPLDAGYLDGQLSNPAPDDRLRHYLERGLDEGLDPTPYFKTDWYAWQNPDWSQRHPAPYIHYLDAGIREGRDPSPFVDVTRYLDATAGAVPKERVYHAILAGLRAPALGVYEEDADLTACQEAFLSGISLLAHRVTPPANTRRALVVCQAGRGAMLEGWADTEVREWDLMLNYYDAAGMRPGLGEYAVFQKGTKFTAMKLLLDRFASLFAHYDHVLFIDDDIVTTAPDLNRLFALCREHELDLAQMSLSEGSACNWPHLYARPELTGPRAVSAVEIMMPVFSPRALSWIRPTLGQSVSGFGLDLVWGKIVSERGGRIAVLDEVSAIHARPVDQAEGAYYGYLRRNGINAKAELWVLLRRYGADRNVVTL